MSKADKLILPGVGSFDSAIGKLNQSGLRSCLEEIVLEKKVPILGVCVGMQMFASSSEEGVEQGFDWISGRVKSFTGRLSGSSLPIPHMGWNGVSTEHKCPLFPTGYNSIPEVYFLHSYFFEADDEGHVVGHSHYGFRFASAVHKDNVFGVQFHPEKVIILARTCLKLLRIFAK